MSQASLLLSAPAPDSGNRVKVLAPFPLAKAYDYALPEGLRCAPGDYIYVEMGKRKTPAVVWSTEGDNILPASKLKTVIRRFDLPPLPEAHRRFVEKTAAYTMSDLGSVLKMTLSVPAVFDPPKKVPQAYTLSGTLAPDSLSPQREAVLKLLSDGKPRKAADIAKKAKCSASTIKAMEKDGLLHAVDIVPDPPGMLHDVPPSPISLSDVQAKAAETLVNAVRAKKYSATLLDGVTGSGKTEVYFEAVAEALKQGKQALVLLPEIALSAQFLERFTRRFGQEPALWHSEVTAAKRRITWRGVAEGRVKIVVGARSALYLPYPDLGLIVVDEEHDGSYKQEEGVLYSARDMAVLRANIEQFPAILVSATPALETMENVHQGKYACVHLPERYAGAELPPVSIVNLKEEKPDRQRFLSPPLKDALAATLEAGEQSLLFLNRRGYAPLTLCRTCGHRFQCPSCSAWLVEHRKFARLQCHHCGHAMKLPKNCPSCNDEDSFAACGPGVERIEEEVRELFPEARTRVLASDNVTSAGAIREEIRAIENREIDIIIGTQIVAKGHHFPALTLVGVVDADLGLSGGDLRAGERTFQLLQQVAGRAGRGEKPGRVILQTFMPEQTVIQALAAGDRDAFLRAESKARELAGMPPFGRLAALIVSGKNPQQLDDACRTVARAAPRYDDIRILGPAEAPLAFLRGKHRRRFLIKANKGVALQDYLRQWLDAVKIPAAVQLKVDIDPQSFF